MAEEQTPSVDNALRRMRATVFICCTVVIASLLVQTGVWALATFTDVRFNEVIPDRQAKPVQDDSVIIKTPIGQAAEEPLAPIHVRSRFDMLFRDATAMALGAGVMAMFVLFVLITVMVIVVANASAPTLNEAVAGLTWAVIVAALVLPTEGVVHLPWGGSALRPYDDIVRQVDSTSAGALRLEDYVMFLLVPLVCCFATIIVGKRFGTVARNWLPEPGPFLDPALEDEVSRIRPTSLHGSTRSASALKHVVKEPAKKAEPEPVAAGLKERPIGQPDPGPMPRRII